MPRRVAIIQGHPDPAGNRFCHALADAYAEGAVLGRHEVARIEPAKLDFPILRTQRDFETGDIPEVLTPARDAIIAAQHLLIIFPLWHGTMPARAPQSLYRTSNAARGSSRIPPGGLPASPADRALGSSRRDDGDAGPDLSMVFPSARGARSGAEHSQICRHEAGARDASWDGAGRERSSATGLARPDKGPRQETSVIRFASVMPASRSLIARCHSAAQRTASTTLGNSANIASPVVFTMRPECSLIFGSTSSRRYVFRRPCVASRPPPSGANTPPHRRPGSRAFAGTRTARVGV